MKLIEIKKYPGKPFTCTKGTSCKTIQLKDTLVFNEEDGTLSCFEAAGWLEKGEWETLMAQVEPRDCRLDHERKKKMKKYKYCDECGVLL